MPHQPAGGQGGGRGRRDRLAAGAGQRDRRRACRTRHHAHRHAGDPRGGMARDARRRSKEGSMIDPILNVAIKAALAAGEEIMRVYAEPFDVVQKSDQTPVTEADLAAERVIVKMLGEAFPGIPVVSEETAPDDGFKPPAARFWVVDPLDGTKEFVAKNGEFCVCIALVEDGAPVMG